LVNININTLRRTVRKYKNSTVFNIVSECTLQHTEITRPVTGRAS